MGHICVPKKETKFKQLGLQSCHDPSPPSTHTLGEAVYTASYVEKQSLFPHPLHLGRHCDFFLPIEFMGDDNMPFLSLCPQGALNTLTQELCPMSHMNKNELGLLNNWRPHRLELSYSSCLRQIPRHVRAELTIAK